MFWYTKYVGYKNKNRFSKIFFLGVLHDDPSVESL